MNSPQPQREYKETAAQFAKQSELYKKVFDATEGNYEAKSKAAQEAVTQYRRTALGQQFRSELAKQVAELAPMPEAGEPDTELSQLSREKVAAWLERYQGNLGDALVAMFRLDPQFRMTDKELALFKGELKDPAHLKHKTFFALTDWIDRVKRGGQSVGVETAAVVDNLLSDMAKNQAPTILGAQKAA